MTTVHPRVCGGNTTTGGIAGFLQGPSPRVRGKLTVEPPAVPQQGSIPACAGETGRSGCRPHPIPVHPRVCGGNRMHVPLSLHHEGPSPRVRGKHQSPMPVTGSGCRPHPIPWVHPRVCGGNDARKARHCIRVRVHPRVCGGNDGSIERASPSAGPSPPGENRVTGVHPRVCGGNFVTNRAVGLRVRSIPACAGETIRAVSFRHLSPVHPRVCGGNPTSGQCMA